MSKAKGDTEIRMNFTTGNAAAARNIVQEIYKNQTAQMRAINRQAQETRQSFASMGAGMMKAAAAFVGLSTASAALANMRASADAIGAKKADLEAAITPLSSLGDNAGKLGTIRREVAIMAAAYNVDVQKMAATLFDLQSTTGNLSDTVRGELKGNMLDLAKATGGDLATANNLLVKSYQIVGDEVANITQLTNKLLLTQDQAAVTFEDLATRAPELLSAGKIVGVSLDETLASIIAATKKSGSIEKTFTGLRNVFLIMQEAQENGIELTGTYTDKLAQLRQQFTTNTAGMAKLFGRENVVHAKSLVDATEDLKTNLEALSKVSGDSSKAQAIIRQRLQDPVHRMVEIRNLNAQLRANMPNLAAPGAPANFLQRMSRRGELGQLAIQYETGLDENSWAAKYGYFRGMVSAPGDRDLLLKGRAAELANTPPGPLRDVLLQEMFNARRSAELESAAPQSLVDLARRASPFRNRTLEAGFDLAAEDARYPYQDPEVRDTLKAIERGTNRTNQLLEGMGRNVYRAPGGSRANAQEAI